MSKKVFLKSLLAMGLSSTAFGAYNYVPGEVIVKLKKNVKSTSLNKDMFDIGDVKALSANGHVLMKSFNKTNTQQMIAELNNHPLVEYAEPNFIYTKQGQKLDGVAEILAAADPKFSDLWGLHNTGDNEPRSDRGNSAPTGISGVDVNAINAWSITKGDKRLKIAVIDTGVDYNHPDLKDNMWTNTAELNGVEGVDDDGNGYIDDIHGYDFANQDGDPMDGNGHGTHCAGTIAAAHNDIGIAGVMKDAQIVGVKFLTDDGSGTTAAAIESIDYATKIGVDIMSNSWGGGGRSQALEDAIIRANDAGIIFTAAAGNSATDNDSKAQYPANYDVANVISVAAHNYNDQLASFSCYGKNTVHVAAPGRNILSTTPNNDYKVYSGTSMATPHVTGVIGLYLAEHGRTDAETLRTQLMESSVYAKAYDMTTVSSGRVDAYSFLQKQVMPRPERPVEADWNTMSVDVFETEHPYPVKTTMTKSYTVPGAKFLRLRVSKIDLEKGYDFIKVMNSDGEVAQKLTGQGSDVTSMYVSGDTINLEFVSDFSVTGWGFLIEEIDYILE